MDHGPWAASPGQNTPTLQGSRMEHQPNGLLQTAPGFETASQAASGLRVAEPEARLRAGNGEVPLYSSSSAAHPFSLDVSRAADSAVPQQTAGATGSQMWVHMQPPNPAQPPSHFAVSSLHFGGFGTSNGIAGGGAGGANVTAGQLHPHGNAGLPSSGPEMPRRLWQGDTARDRGGGPTRSQTRASIALPDDGFVWLKYGEKQLIYPRRTRAYFKCEKSKTDECKAKKVVDFNAEDPTGVAPVISYIKEHNHPSSGAQLSLSQEALAGQPNEGPSQQQQQQQQQQQKQQQQYQRRSHLTSAPRRAVRQSDNITPPQQPAMMSESLSSTSSQIGLSTEASHWQPHAGLSGPTSSIPAATQGQLSLTTASQAASQAASGVLCMAQLQGSFSAAQISSRSPDTVRSISFQGQAASNQHAQGSQTTFIHSQSSPDVCMQGYSPQQPGQSYSRLSTTNELLSARYMQYPQSHMAHTPMQHGPSEVQFASQGTLIVPECSQNIFARTEAPLYVHAAQRHVQIASHYSQPSPSYNQPAPLYSQPVPLVDTPVPQYGPLTCNGSIMAPSSGQQMNHDHQGRALMDRHSSFVTGTGPPNSHAHSLPALAAALQVAEQRQKANVPVVSSVSTQVMSYGSSTSKGSISRNNNHSSEDLMGSQNMLAASQGVHMASQRSSLNEVGAPRRMVSPAGNHLIHAESLTQFGGPAFMQVGLTADLSQESGQQGITRAPGFEERGLHFNFPSQALIPSLSSRVSFPAGGGVPVSSSPHAPGSGKIVLQASSSFAIEPTRHAQSQVAAPAAPAAAHAHPLPQPASSPLQAEVVQCSLSCTQHPSGPGDPTAMPLQGTPAGGFSEYQMRNQPMWTEDGRSHSLGITDIQPTLPNYSAQFEPPDASRQSTQWPQISDYQGWDSPGEHDADAVGHGQALVGGMDDSSSQLPFMRAPDVHFAEPAPGLGDLSQAAPSVLILHPDALGRSAAMSLPQPGDSWSDDCLTSPMSLEEYGLSAARSAQGAGFQGMRQNSWPGSPGQHLGTILADQSREPCDLDELG